MPNFSSSVQGWRHGALKPKIFSKSQNTNVLQGHIPSTIFTKLSRIVGNFMIDYNKKASIR